MRKRHLAIILVVALAPLFASLVESIPSARAGTLARVSDFLNRTVADQIAGTEHQLFFTTATAVSGGSGANRVVVIFPDTDDGQWCRAAGTGTATGITQPTGGGEAAAALPGSLTVSCSQGSGSSSFDTITVSGVNNLAISTTYGVRVTGGTMALGTPAASTTGLVTVRTTPLDIVPASETNVSVTAVVPAPTPPTPPDTIVSFSGIAYPASQVTFERQGTILATVPADPSARFSISFGSQPAGTWTYTVYAEDAAGRVGRTSNFTLAITAGTTTTVSGIFLGPTIATDQSTIELSETVTVLGATLPTSTVTVYVSSEEEVTFQTTAGSDGLWTRQFLGSDVGVGDHNIRSKAVSTAAEISGFSSTIPLTVTEAAAPPPAAEEPDPCDGKNRADLNCDGRVYLIDFSILLFYWDQTNPANARTDINGDGRVGLVDFSIMLFNWTG